MPKVILLVNVELQTGKREEYLAAIDELRKHFRETGSVDYTVFENQGKEKDSFTEMFTFPDMSAYEAFDDGDEGGDADEPVAKVSNELFGKIIDMAKRPPKYTTLVEVG